MGTNYNTVLRSLMSGF